jgi:transposase-like protein
MGIGVTITSQLETSTPDQRKRQRKQRTGRTMGILVALGCGEDGRRDVRDGQLARHEDHHAWEPLVQRFWERGCKPEQGWLLVVRDGRAG